ncbi:hypothetical protein GM415_03590 [Pseudodesulfovibrio cashew]|uniref:Uncharacterized protein n=1 Tax=Pseudodesulfovibrio cashew TaxID=2678688 RepID=A0A6I6JFP7_9BACT|nr:hypothetical protein [Pseudodesulfovibrio cashew]QGY39242.1 hypothetical protein GM415_03590 [Pseudodesulfovibrio cashew]
MLAVMGIVFDYIIYILPIMILYLFVVFLSSSPLLSYFVGIFISTPFLIAMLNRRKSGITHLLRQMVTMKSLSFFVLFSVPVIVAFAVSGLAISFFKEVYVPMAAFVLTFSISFSMIAPSLYSVATGGTREMLNLSEGAAVCIVLAIGVVGNSVDKFVVSSNWIESIIMTLIICLSHVLTLFFLTSLISLRQVHS